MRSGGIKTYLYNLARGLRAARGDQVALFPFLDVPAALDHDRSALPRGGTAARIAALILLNRGLLPARWLVRRCDLFHASNQVRRRPGHSKLTATIHDLTSWLSPEWHTSATIHADRESAEQVWKRADGLIAVSHRTKQDAVEILGIPAERVRVIYHGVSASYLEAGSAEAAEARQAFTLPPHYVLFVSTIEPRKNLDRLITAHQRLPATLRAEYPLVVVGPQGWKSADTMLRLRGGGDVRYLGYVPEAWMPGLFAGAALFAYPSLYEGFGLPMIQAMATGTPVLAARAGALPEIGGEAAAFADARSSDEMTEVLRRLLESPDERRQRSAQGRARAAEFRWETCANETWQFFEAVAGSHG